VGYIYANGSVRAPGAVQGDFTSKSDVWSFAVTLWEILTLARRRPFASLSDDDVIANCRRHHHHAAPAAAAGSVPPPALLERPSTCPREIYDLMVECWRTEPHQRPTFREMHMFLQRKNSGYSPDDEPLHSHYHQHHQQHQQQHTVSDV